MANVLVTGATGFIGYHLVRALAARGDQIACLVRKSSQTERIRPLGVELRYGDITDPDSLIAALKGCSIVYHVAGLTIALRKQSFYQINEQGTRHLAQACANVSNPPVLVLVSSLAAAGPARRGRLRVETDPPRPISHYGRSKRAGEIAVEQVAQQVPVTIVRPPIVFGETDTFSLPIFQSIVRTRLHFVPNVWPHRYSMLHAADLAELLILASERGKRIPPKIENRDQPPGQGVYFAASRQHPNYYEFGRMLTKALKLRRTLILPAGKPAIWITATFNEMIARIRNRAAILNFDKAREATTGPWACSCQSATNELGFSVATPLEARLHQTAHWYRKEGWL